LYLSINLPSFSKITFALKSKPLKRSDRSCISRIHIGFDSVQVKHFESIYCEEIIDFLFGDPPK